MSFFKKTKEYDEDCFVNIGEFWYPKKFYDMYDEKLLQVPLLHFLELTKVKEIGNFLLDIRDFKPTRSFELYERYIKVNAPQQINISDERRNQVADFLDSVSGYSASRQIPTYPSSDPERMVDHRKVWTSDNNPIFKGCKQDVESLFVANYTEENSPQTFWQSPMFLAMHNYRTKRLFKFLRRKKAIPVTKLSTKAFDHAQAVSTNNAGLNNLGQMAARLGVTEEQLREEMENAFNYD